jgi:two-component system sensor histidine kinase RpfC
MNTSAKTNLSGTSDPPSTGGRYHSTAFFVSCVVVCYLAVQFLWLIPTAEQLATITLALYFSLIRMTQLITIRKPYRLALNIHGPLIVFDQIYLAAMSLYGLPVYLSLPLSGVLLFTARSLGAGYIILAIPAAFVSILFTLIDSNGFLLDILTAIAISLATVTVASLNTIWPLITSLTHTPSRSAKRKPEENKTLGSGPNPQHNSRFLSPIVEESGPRILVISNNDNRLASLSKLLNEWGYEHTSCRNCVRAFRHLLSRVQVNSFITYTTLIVDQQGLDLDPVSLAQLIHDESKLEGIRLICFKAPTGLIQQSQQLYQAGYAALLETPLSKSQLFDALHKEHRRNPDSNNIVSLSEHRKNQNSNAAPEIVLLADAASSARSALGNALNQADYKVIMVEDGNKALDALEDQPISLAIININLATMSGTQVLKLHRFTTPHKHWVPFIFISDENNADTLRLCRSIGVQTCFFKPVDMNNLLEIIPILIIQHQTRDNHLGHYPRAPGKNNVTYFQNTSLLDLMTLLRLERLDSGIAFINDLFKIFQAEGTIVIQTMRHAVDKNQFGLFLDQAQILLDSAGQLGALALYELNRKATRLRAREFDYRGIELLEEIEETFNLTLEAYSHYLSQRAATLQQDSI